MRSLWRCHAALQEIIWLALEGDVEHAVAFACQTSKALHQVALDRGGWDNALPMIPVADILQEPQFGGEEVEMKMIHSYKKAIREIKTQHTVSDARKEEEGPGEGAKGSADSSNKQKKKKAACAAKLKARAAVDA